MKAPPPAFLEHRVSSSRSGHASSPEGTLGWRVAGQSLHRKSTYV